ncbi:Outer membrane protein TolC [Ferrimonas sediminum]|uniref:Outer membrane protein TolC n=1 Tax=Ferrimonas sediminum TaxID=718193 RepID=A0A1G8KA35_9GAMM|nr:TolC family protein [Ferrimonas sediminum]SDI40336.1 Outer membrane protein TolC [Ferrimonas sediminum]
MRYWIGILACICTAATAQPLSLLQAWQRVETVSDKLQAEHQAENRAAAELGAAEQLGMPSLSLSGSYTRLDKPIELDSRAINPIGDLLQLPQVGAIAGQLGLDLSELNWKTELTDRDIYHASLKAVWPLYVGGRIEAAQAIKAAELDQQKQQGELSRQERFTTLVERYFAVVLSTQVEQLQRQRLQTLTEHLQHAEAMQKQGQIAEVERLNAQVAMEQGQVALSQARRRSKLAHMALNTLLQQNQVDTAQGLGLPLTQPDLDRWQRQMLEVHPALALYHAKEAQAQGAIDAEKGRYKPEVALFGNYTLETQDTLAAELEPDWLVGVTVKVPLFTNDGRSDRVRAAKSAQLQVQHLRAQTQQDLELLMASRGQELSQAQHEYRALATAEKLAKENLRLRKLAFSQGLSTSIEQVDASDKLLEVQTARAAAQYRYLVALGQLAAMSSNQQRLFQLLERTESE